ncbi:ABC transporter permease, partial [Clostridium perfringens]|nr:ABC transporter permease [Clostridium perfringens]
MNTNKKNKTLMVLSIPVVFLIICIGTSIGSSNISIMDIISIISHKIFNTQLLQGIEAKDVS